MKAVLLAGGLGTRLSEETTVRPKPMVEIGGRPILWHIMKMYSHHGIDDFVVCCGYKGYVIKEYFANYFLHMSDVTFDMAENKMEVHRHQTEPWRVTLLDTGDEFGQHGAAPLPGARFGGVDTRTCNFDRTTLPRGKPRSITERQTGALGSQRGSVNGQREQSAGQRQT